MIVEEKIQIIGDKMKIPGFSAEACIEERRNRWSHRQEASGRQRGEPQRPVLVPQLRGPGSEGGLASCIDDCVDTHPGWTAKLCRKACLSSPDGPPPLPANPTNRDLGIAGCWFVWAGCEVSPIGFLCDELRDHCLAENRG
jgi:hypothetical protein